MQLLRVRAECLAEPRRGMLSEGVFRRFKEANRRDAEAWAGVRTVADWERLRDERIGALRDSLGPLPGGEGPARVERTGQIAGEGYRIEKLVYLSHPGQPVSALLYLPDPIGEGMPGILIAHSHHHSKEQRELQDMGVSWSRSGAAVLVPDMVGHGERSDNPFGGRQDYYGRYFSGMQLHLAGMSLMGWMVRDLTGGVDVLCATEGVDAEKIIVVGAVAGGGDPAAVTAALDPRVKCSVPFNFGKACNWPKRMGATEADGLNFCDSGSFEGTRNLRLSARDGFPRWLIVAAVAPRPLVYAHEFEWVPEKDPVWERFRKIYALYGAEDRLATVHGRGGVKGPGGPENTHCTNVGPIHREQIYPAWEKWFGFKVEESQDRREAGELACFTEAARAALESEPIHRICARAGAELLAAARREIESLDAAGRGAELARRWAERLGDVQPRGEVRDESVGVDELFGARSERLLLTVEPGVVVPALLVSPGSAGPHPAVLCVAQEGKNCFLRARIPAVARLLEGGVAVCLADLRGTGETAPDAERGREGEATDVSADELMLGGTLLGSRVRDLRAVFSWLKSRRGIRAERLALWGASFSAVNPPDFTPPPQDGDGIDLRTNGGGPREGHRPALAEPLGPLAALFGALFEPEVGAVLLEGGLTSFESMLAGAFTYAPHDCHVAGALSAGDLGDVAGSLGIPLLSVGEVDGLDRPAPGAELAARPWERGTDLADWLLAVLKPDSGD
jgi:dienelactone hydrolase